MRFLSISTFVTFLGALTVSAATRAVYINQTDLDVPPAIAPTIDATRFVNKARFNINVFTVPSLPYETLNTRFFTNEASGIVMGSPGFNYDFFTNNSRRIMNAWHNEGEMSGQTFMTVWARNIRSLGPVSAGPSGLLRLRGENIDVVGTGLRAGLAPGTFFFSGGRFQTNYFNAPGVSDLWWAAATNNTLNSMGGPVRVDNTNGNLRPFFGAPCTLSPFHEAIGPVGFTNRISLPLFAGFFGGTCLKEFDAFAFTQQIDQTTRVVQVAFVSRNALDTNFTTRVRFVPDDLDDPFEQLGFDEGHTILVELGSVERDIVSDSFNTNKIYFVDRSAFTNAGLFRNFVGNTRRPSTMEVRRDVFGFGGGGFGTNQLVDIFAHPRASTGNVAFTTSLLYNPSFQSNAVSMGYAAYGAFIDSTGVTNNSGPGTTHPTNFPGRVEIIGDNVNLDGTRIRAENTAVIKAQNLIGNNIAQVDAPFCSYDLGSQNPPLVVSNLAPPFVQRLSGRIAAWSATWENTDTNSGMFTRFHVLMVDNNLNSITPVTITDVALRSETVVISDFLNVQDQFVLEGENLHITGGLNLLSGASWSAANIKGLVNLTNDGVLSFQGTGFLGSQGDTAYQNFVNRGTNTAAAEFITADYFENTGCIVANSGVISINAGQAVITGGETTVVTNLFTNFLGNIDFFVTTNISGKIQASSGIDITAGSLYASDSFIQAGTFGRGALTLSIAESLTDGGPGSSNHWVTSAGFRMLSDPASGNLLGTHITSLARENGQIVFHSWAGEDVGNTPSGFDNNLALMKLTLDGIPNTKFVFTNSPGKSSSAIYVDYLELLNNATNYNDIRALDIRSGVRIYFANANVPPSKLDESHLPNGKLIWVKDYAGPLSGTNIVYPTPPYPPGTVVRANIGLATSKDDDSDADGIANADDPDPFFISTSVGLTISSKEGEARLSWNALGKATNILECTADPRGTSWTTVTNFVQGDYTTRVTIRDSLSNDSQRVYRVRVLPPQ